MSIRLNPYLGFQGKAREAMTFYQSVLGGELTVTTFGEAGGMGMPEDQHDQVMHAQLDVSPGVMLMGADMGEEPTPQGTVSLSGPHEDAGTLQSWFEGLSEGGEVTLPLAQAPWGDHFGQLTDKFGTSWMMNIAGS